MTATTAATLAVQRELRAASDAESERAEYQRIREELPEMLEKGIQKNVWYVHTDAEGLPHANQWYYQFFRGIKQGFKRNDESNESYLKRVFDSFDLYGRNHTVIANQGILYLFFDKDKQGTTTEQKEVQLFKPKWTTLDSIVETLPVHTTASDIRFNRYHEHYRMALPEIDLPDSVVYK